MWRSLLTEGWRWGRPFKRSGVGSVFHAFLAAGHCNPALVATSSLSHTCPGTFLQMLLERLKANSWIKGDNEAGDTVPEEMLEGLFTSRKFILLVFV